jgi:hypothetical protein
MRTRRTTALSAIITLLAAAVLVTGCNSSDKAVEPAGGEQAAPGSSDTVVDVDYEVGQGQRGRRR